MQKILLCFMILLLTACNLSMPGSQGERLTPSDLSTPDNPTPVVAQTDWVTYQNTTHNYSLQHPANLMVVENAPSNEVLIDDQISVQVVDGNPEFDARSGTVIEGAEDVTMWQYTGRQLRGYVGAIGGNIPHSIEQVVLRHNGKYYVLTVAEIKRSAMVGNGRGFVCKGPSPLKRWLYSRVL